MIIPFEQDARTEYYKLLDDVFDSSFWSEGKMTKEFERLFEESIGIGSRSVANGGAGLLAIFEYLDVRGQDVVVPANTFWATAIAAQKAGANVIYADCNKQDLCLSYEDLIKKVTSKTKAVVVVHIGGHIAFDIEKIAAFCKEKNIFLVEDCAHAHGAKWNGKAAGSWGFAGSYSFYATKTLPLGEGGMVVSKNFQFLEWLERYRNYGKKVTQGMVSYPITNGFNYRISEMTAALGIVQMRRLPQILAWKRELAKKYDQIFDNRVILPEGMFSGYYKYIVFDYNLKEATGKVFNKSDFGSEIQNKKVDLPNSEWVAKHHFCVPIFHGWERGRMPVDDLRRYLLGE